MIFGNLRFKLSTGMVPINERICKLPDSLTNPSYTAALLPKLSYPLDPCIKRI